ncbi:MAG: ribokinase [Chloroflexi bacterium]|nr:ribokinase [Chloroflexota bacterium]
MKKRITVVGSSNVDLIMKMDRLPRVGESVTDADFRQTFGGKGANQAYAATLAGRTSPPTEVTFVSCVGDDAYGAQVIENMRAAGANVEHVFVEPGVATGTALIMIGEAGRNYISVAPGANYCLRPEHVERAAAAIDACDLLVLQYEVPVETGIAAARRAHAHGIPVMLNLAPPRPISDDFLSMLDYFVVNETEAAFVLGFDVDSDKNVRRAAAALLARGPRNVIITLGEKGAFVATGDGQSALVPSFPVTAIDTTAAGDTFCGAFAVALLENRPPLEAAHFANAAAAITVTRLGAQAAVPTREEIDEFQISRS